MPPPPHPIMTSECDLQKRAFYEQGFRSAGVKMYVYGKKNPILKWYNVSMSVWESMIFEP